ncbi:MAG TPA: 30S ribosomal protein S6 [Chitinivibrionales bacterium]
MKQIYETVVIFDGTLSEETIRKENGKLEEFLKSHGEFEKVDVWGKRSLAYSIKKKKSGIYHLYTYSALSEINVAGKIEKLFQLNETVLRHLTVVKEFPKISEKRVRRGPPPMDAEIEGEE